MAWAYEMSHEDLLKEFMRKCAEVGRAGLCIDISEPFNRLDMHYLRGVVLSRLEGAGLPPFKPEQKVRLVGNCELGTTGFCGRKVRPGEILTVERIYYLHSDRVLWTLQFKGRGYDEERGIPNYDASKFELVLAESSVPST